MGDMADYFLDMHDYFDEDYYDIEQDDESLRPATFSCKYCNEEFLHWELTEHGWRLGTLDDNNHWKIHKCPKNLAPEFRK